MEIDSDGSRKATLHNHIVYHTLSLFALGASPDLMLHHTKRNTTYQLVPPKFPDETTLRLMAEPETLKGFIGKEEYFLDFCAFFEQEIEKLGYEDVLQKYLVGDNDIAKDIFPRIYHGAFQVAPLLKSRTFLTQSRLRTWHHAHWARS